MRNFCLKPAYNEIKNIAGKKTVEKLKNNSLLLLEGKRLEIIDSVDVINETSDVSILKSFINLIKGE